MSRSQVVLLLALLVAPTALAHGGEDHDGDGLFEPTGNNPNAPRQGATRPIAAPSDKTLLPSGYTGPANEPYKSFFEGTWLYGHASVTPLDGQAPVDLQHDGDWLVWEDTARSDIYAFSVSAGQGYYLTNDSFQQHRPRISNGIVVWEDYRDDNRSAVWMYDLATSETRRVSRPGPDVAKPTTDGKVVAWTSIRGTATDVRAYGLANSTEWAVAASRDREQDPLVVDDKIFWRALRFNIWDVMGFDLRTGEHFGVTVDRFIQSAPFDNGTNAFYLSQSTIGGWKLSYFDNTLGRGIETKWTLPSSRPASISGDHLLLIARDVRYQQLVVRNITNSVTTHVTGNLLLATDPIIADDHVFAVVRTAKGTRLLDLKVSPFVFSPPPKLIVFTDTSVPWVQPMRMAGRLEAGPSWTAPLTFTYRINDAPPQAIAPNTTWAFTLDPTGFRPGYYMVTIRATFREGPPVEQTHFLMVPQRFAGVDLPGVANYYHNAIVASMTSYYITDNPGSYVLIPLVIVLLAVLLFRVWLWRRSRGPLRLRREKEPEYVAPDPD